MSDSHELKTWPQYFWDVVAGIKKVEIRKNDRDFKLGDVLVLFEFDPEVKSYTGRHVEVVVTHILKDQPFVPKGYVAMSIDRLEAVHEARK